MDKEKKELAAEMRREARIWIIKIASIVIAVAIVVACYAYTKVYDEVTESALYMLASVLCGIGVFLITAAISVGRAEKKAQNFFLYDRKKKEEMPVSSLTVQQVRDKVVDFMSIFKRGGKLYIADLFDENPGIPEYFKPLFCYEILFELANGEGMDAGAFLRFGSECAEVFSKYLRENEDYELATSLSTFILEHSKGYNNTEDFKNYLRSKKEHISEKMLGYAVTNIEKFN